MSIFGYVVACSVGMCGGNGGMCCCGSNMRVARVVLMGMSLYRGAHGGLLDLLVSCKCRGERMTKHFAARLLKTSRN